MWVFGLEHVVPPLVITFELLKQPCDYSVIPTLWLGQTMLSVLHANLISCRFAFCSVASRRASLVVLCGYLFRSSYLFCKLWLHRVLIAAGAFLTDVDSFPWKSQSDFCVVRATHKFKSLGFVCSSSFFSLSAACRLFSRGVIFTRARVSLALLSLRQNGGLLVV